MKAKISEVFKSIQGEGIYVGFPQIFVRFWGCNIHCSYCDTRFPDYKELSIDETITSITAYLPAHSLALTGGEPLLFPGFLEQLLPKVKQLPLPIYLETNGILHKNMRRLRDNFDIIAMNWKFPSSLGGECYYTEHMLFLKEIQRKKVFLKMVITRDTTQDELITSLGYIKQVDVDIPLVVQPEHPFEKELSQKTEAFSVYAQSYLSSVRIIPQLHKVLGVR